MNVCLHLKCMRRPVCIFAAKRGTFLFLWSGPLTNASCVLPEVAVTTLVATHALVCGPGELVCTMLHIHIIHWPLLLGQLEFVTSTISTGIFLQSYKGYRLLSFLENSVSFKQSSSNLCTDGCSAWHSLGTGSPKAGAPLVRETPPQLAKGHLSACNRGMGGT